MKKTLLIIGLLLTFATVPFSLQAQQASYSQTNLVSNTAGVAATTDPQLLNPWGIAYVPGQDFWVANNNSGTSTLYDGHGTKDNNLVVNIPGATRNPNGNCNPGCPTGTVANANGGVFGGGIFLFDTEDGLIASWNGTSNNAAVMVDNSASGAVYKGLALLNGQFLLAANFNAGKVDVFDHNFNTTHLSGSFTNPNLPAGLAPHGIHVIGNGVWVAYAMQDAAKHDAQPGAGVGQVDIFDANGNFVKTFAATGGALNAPWGVVAAPATFGQFANDILIGNFGDGTINAYDANGHPLGQVTNATGVALVNPGLWDMVFGGGGASGDPNTLYLTAGGSNQPNFAPGGTNLSVFASLIPVQAAGTDFSLSLSAQSLTIVQGGSANVTVDSSALGGFNGQVTLSCSAVASITCAFNPATISPGGTVSSSNLVVSVAQVPPGGGYGPLGALAVLPGLGLLGTFLTSSARKQLTRKNMLRVAAGALLLGTLSFALGCGSSTSNKPVGSQVNLLVKGTSGPLTHTMPIAITVH